jgi:hypothetical protein
MKSDAGYDADMLPTMMQMQSQAEPIVSEKPTHGALCFSKDGATAAGAEVQLGKPPDSDTTLGVTSTVLEGGRLDKSVEGPTELHSNGNSSDGAEDENRDRPWRTQSNAPVKLSAQLPQEYGFAVATDRQ